MLSLVTYPTCFIPRNRFRRLTELEFLILSNLVTLWMVHGEKIKTSQKEKLPNFPRGEVLSFPRRSWLGCFWLYWFPCLISAIHGVEIHEISVAINTNFLGRSFGLQLPNLKGWKGKLRLETSKFCLPILKICLNNRYRNCITEPDLTESSVENLYRICR